MKRNETQRKTSGWRFRIVIFGSEFKVPGGSRGDICGILRQTKRSRWRARSCRGSELLVVSLFAESREMVKEGRTKTIALVVFRAHVGQDLMAEPSWAWPLSARPLWARPLWVPWALMGRALMGLPGLFWAGPLWARPSRAPRSNCFLFFPRLAGSI